MTRPRLRQDRSRRAKHAHALNTQDFPPLSLSPTERAAWKYVQVVALLADSGPQYELLPPAARMATDAVKQVAKQLEPTINATKGHRPNTALSSKRLSSFSISTTFSWLGNCTKTLF
jgi:uncharacterized protein YceH (UPF0502 family)